MIARLFRIRPGRVTASSLGLPTADGAMTGRVDAIIHAFFTGYDAMVALRDLTAVRRRIEALGPYFRPFAAEGAAMGYGPRTLLRRRPLERFEQTVLRLGEGHLYLYYAGLGWWLGRSLRRPRRIARAIAVLDPRWRVLVYDGAGFSLGLRRFARDRRAHRRLGALAGEARAAAFRGFGRSLWFVFQGAAAPAERVLAGLAPGDRRAGYEGLGLAAAFTTIDDPAGFFRSLARLHPEARARVWAGAAFGWAARRMSDPAYFHAGVGRLAPRRAQLVGQTLRVLDDVEHDLTGHTIHRATEPSFLTSWMRETGTRLRRLQSEGRLPA